MEPCIREGGMGDLFALAAMEAAVFPDDAWSENALSLHLAAEHNRVLVAEKDGVPVGYLLFSVLPPESELYRVACLSDCRKCGIGDRLMTAYLGAISACGVTDAFLEVRESNEAAIALYEKHGYTKVGCRKNYYRCPTENAAVYKRTEKEDLC